MDIDEVILKLQEYKQKHGGKTEVRVAGGHEYWGTLYNKVDEFTLRFDEKTTLNPKIMEDKPAVVFCFGYDI